VDDRLGGGEAQAVAAHVQECAPCQETLDRLTGGPSPAGVRRGADEPSAAFVERLKGAVPLDPGPTVPAALSPGPEGWPRVPGYEILGELGRGGMGVVYKARHLALKRTVALKMILAGEYAEPTYRARFRAEAEVLARLAHPNIVQIYEAGESDGRPFIALEHVAGGTLRRYCGKPHDPYQAARLVQTLAAAVHFAHRHGVVHRDLKPANILLASPPTPNPSPTVGGGEQDAPPSPRRGRGGLGG
jgi:eukaryotic-like serine/threonine-protein kinase